MGRGYMHAQSYVKMLTPNVLTDLKKLGGGGGGVQLGKSLHYPHVYYQKLII